MNHQILNFMDLVLYNSDMDSLNHNINISDNIVEFCIKLLAYNNKKNKSLLLTNKEVDSIKNIRNLEFYDLIFLPLKSNKNGSLTSDQSRYDSFNRDSNDRWDEVWSLLLFNRADNTFYYYDSLKSGFNKAKETAQKLQQILNINESKFRVMYTPSIPSNAYCDNSIHMLCILEYVYKNARFDVTNLNVDAKNKRMEIKNSILDIIKLKN